MVKMYPSECNSETTYSEKKFFKTIQLSFINKNYLCFHSLGNDYHHSKTYSEIDFTLITQEGFIFCIEHKGGSVEIDKYSTKVTSGRKSYKKENVVKQVEGSRRSLIKYMKNFPNYKIFTIEWCLAFPEDPIVKSSIEIQDWRIFKGTYNSIKFETFINNLIDNLRPSYPYIRNVNNKDIGELVEYLKPDIRIKNFDDESNLELITLQKYQLDKLESVTNGKIKRIIFNGGPGSGKTVLATNMAKSLSKKNYKVLFLCFNIMLAEKLNNELNNYDNITCINFDKFIIENIKSKKYDHLLKRNYSNKIELFFHLIKNESLFKEEHDKYDLLILDEAQDLMNENSIKAIFMAIKGNIGQGSFALFLDKNVQAEMYNNFDSTFYNNFINNNVIDYALNHNYRNPRGIINKAAYIRRIDPPISKRTYESFPYIKTFLNKKNDENRVILEVYNEIVKKNNVDKIIILFAYNKYLDSFKIELNKSDLSSEKINYNTVSAFKGLEKEIVILAGIGDLSINHKNNNWITSIIYVGLTRSTKEVYMVTNKRNLKFL